MPTRFDEFEFEEISARLRYGYSREQWAALPEDEQIDAMAHQYIRNQYLDTLLDSFYERIRTGKPVEQAAYVTALIERYSR